MVIYEPYPTIPLTELQEELRFEYPDLPEQLFDYYLTRTAVDMAERGNLLKRRAIIHMESGITRYALRSPDELRLWAILGVWRGDPCHVREVPRSFTPPPGCVCLSPGTATVWWDDQEEVLHVSDMCPCGTLYVSMAVVPDRKACSLPRVYQEEYLETLLMGTRSAIMLITGRPWTNLRLGGQMRAEYYNMIKTLSVDKAMKQQRGTVKINFGRAL